MPSQNAATCTIHATSLCESPNNCPLIHSCVSERTLRIASVLLCSNSPCMGLDSSSVVLRIFEIRARQPTTAAAIETYWNVSSVRIILGAWYGFLTDSHTKNDQSSYDGTTQPLGRGTSVDRSRAGSTSVSSPHPPQLVPNMTAALVRNNA